MKFSWIDSRIIPDLGTCTCTSQRVYCCGCYWQPCRNKVADLSFPSRTCRISRARGPAADWRADETEDCSHRRSAGGSSIDPRSSRHRSVYPREEGPPVDAEVGSMRRILERRRLRVFWKWESRRSVLAWRVVIRGLKLGKIFWKRIELDEIDCWILWKFSTRKLGGNNSMVIF